jgi:hypothetical protein
MIYEKKIKPKQFYLFLCRLLLNKINNIKLTFGFTKQMFSFAF